MRVLEFYAKVPYWLVIITQHGLAGRLVYELPCEARFCTMSRAKRSKQQTSQPRSLLVITMLHCKRGTPARFWSGQLRPSVEQLRPYRPGAEQKPRPLRKYNPIVRGAGGGFVGFRSVVSCFVHLSASMESDMRELNSGSIAWRPRHSLTAAALRMEFNFHGGGAAPVLPNL